MRRGSPTTGSRIFGRYPFRIVGETCNACPVTADSHGPSATEPVSLAAPHILLCALDGTLADAWRPVAEGRPGISVHTGSIVDTPVDAVVSPANSYGWMRGGVDALYANTFHGVEERVRSAVLAYHGGELPVGEAVLVPTGVSRPYWLISAPTMREPGEQLPADTVHPYLAARAVFRLWQDGRLDDGRPVREVISVIGLPGLGTGVGGVDPAVCARQVSAAWDELFGPAH